MLSHSLGVDGPPPEGDDMDLAADPQEITLYEGPVDLVAALSAPRAGVVVNFYWDGDSIGQGTTDDAGVADYWYTPTEAGTFDIDADADGWGDATNTVTVNCPDYYTEGCCGGDLLEPGQQCCGDEAYWPNTRTESWVMDVGRIVQALQGNIAGFGHQPGCSLSSPGSLTPSSLSTTKTYTTMCCDGSVREFYSSGVNITINAIQATCNFPGPYSIPYVATWGITLSATFGVSGDATETLTCGSETPRTCFSGSLNGSLVAGGYGELLDGALALDITGGLSGSASLSGCVGESIHGSFCGSPVGRVVVTYLWFGRYENEWSLGPYCYPPSN